MPTGIMSNVNEWLEKCGNSVAKRAIIINFLSTLNSLGQYWENKNIALGLSGKDLALLGIYQEDLG